MDPSVAMPGMFLELEKRNLCLPCEWAGQALPCVPRNLGVLWVQLSPDQWELRMGIYHLVICASSPWKIHPFLSSVNPGKPSISMGHRNTMAMLITRGYRGIHGDSSRFILTSNMTKTPCRFEGLDFGILGSSLQVDLVGGDWNHGNLWLSISYMGIIIPTDELICFMVIASPTSYQLDIFGPVDPARKMMNTGGCRFFCKTGIPDIPFVAENHHCLS